jgi:DNA polymerase-3 subunit delta'
MLDIKINDIYPWQKENWQILQKIQPQDFQNLLFISDKHIGSEDIIDNYINKLFCNNCCGECSHCNLLKIKQHPDLYYLGQHFVDNNLISNKITIEHVRNMIEQVYLKPQFSIYKIIYIKNCNLLNPNSANALLKILEEPPLYTKFILLAYNINDVLPTILSRCKKLFIHMNSSQDANNIEFLYERFNNKQNFWVNYYKYEPLNNQVISDNALECLINSTLKPSINNIYDTVDILSKEDVSLEFLINFKLKLIHDLLLVINSQSLIFFPFYNDDLKKLAENLNMNKLYQFYDDLIFLFTWREHPINYKLHIENILFQYQILLSK